MHYFRYRPFSEISLKELLYSEMYFSSPEECNDPFDSKTFYQFDSDKKKWVKIIQFASQQYRISIEEKLIDQLANHVCQQCPFNFDFAIKNDLFRDFPLNSIVSVGLIELLSKATREILEIYRPATRYFVSFSRKNSDPLMWSHYADKHRGFCLIFKAINRALNLSPHHRKESVRRKTQKGIAPDMSFELPSSFKFIDIDYKNQVELSNAFLHMPVYVNGEVKDEEERLKITEEQGKHYIQKGYNWEYEVESRLILEPPPSWLFGGHIEYTKQERLFHYEPSQLVGIIYGARMTNEDKARVREILKQRENWVATTTNYKRIEFNFIEFESRLSANQRAVEIVPLSILSYRTIPAADKDFYRLYEEWKEGVGHEREANRSKRIKVI